MTMCGRQIHLPPCSWLAEETSYENSSHEAIEMEETPNFDVLTCSQSSDLGQEQLNEIEQKAQAKSTKKATEWGLKKFDKWCEKRAIKVDLKTIDKKELNKILRKFYAEVKTEKGQALTPSALTGIRAAIHRHLTSAPLHWTAISCLPTKCLKPKPSCLRRNKT